MDRYTLLSVKKYQIPFELYDETKPIFFKIYPLFCELKNCPKYKRNEVSLSYYQWRFQNLYADIDNEVDKRLAIITYFKELDKYVNVFFKKIYIIKTAHKWRIDQPVIYFLEINNEYIKIGKTYDIITRIRGLKQNARINIKKIQILGFLPGYTELEKELHERFSDFAVFDKSLHNNEYFKKEKELLDFIKNNTNKELPLLPYKSQEIYKELFQI